MSLNTTQYLIKLLKNPENIMNNPMTLMDWWNSADRLFIENLRNYVERGTDQDLQNDYRLGLEQYPQIRNVVETYRHETIEHIPRMVQQVWNELGHGNWIPRDVALILCIQYMIDNTMRAARAGPNPPPLPPGGPTELDPPSAGPTGGKFNTYRLRIR